MQRFFSSLPRTARILIATLLTLLCLPCCGFSVFGLLASQEPGANTLGFTLLYSVLSLVLLAILVLSWWNALRIHPFDRPGFCSGCGYDLSGLDEGSCPECGSPAS